MTSKIESPAPIADVQVLNDGTLITPAPTMEDVLKWYETAAKLDEYKSLEINLRIRIARGLFHDPKEGTNTFALADLGDTFGSVIKLVQPINRKVDEAMLATYKDTFEAAQIPSDLIRYTPEVSVKLYRKLTDEQRELVDQVLIIAPGTPQMDIVIPKRKGR